MRHSLILPLCLAMSLAFSSLYAAREWRYVETPHFRLFSECGDRDSRRVALEFERFRSMFSKVFNLELEEGVRLDIFLFRDRRSFEQYSVRHEGKAVGVGGYFVSGPWENMIAMVSGWSRDYTLRTVFHEYTHFLVRKLDWPLWLNEGVAVFYSTFQTSDKEVSLGVPITEHVLLLRERNLMPMEQMNASTDMGHLYENESQVHSFYAQAWAMVHLLKFSEDSDLRSRFRSFLARIKSPSTDPARAFELVFGDYPFEKELRSYVRQHAYMVSKIEMSTEVELEPSIRTIPEAVAVAHLGRLALQMQRPVEAEEHFSRALRKAPDLPEAREGLARIALSKGKFREAEPLLEKVVTQKPDDFMAHWLYAFALSGGRLSGEEMAAKAERIMDECDQVVRISPTFSEAYHRLGEISLFSRAKTELAVERTREGLERFPRDSELRLIHAQLLLGSGDADGARQHLENVRDAASDPQIRNQANEVLGSLDAFAQVAEEVGAPVDPRNDGNPANDTAAFARDRAGPAGTSGPDEALEPAPGSTLPDSPGPPGESDSSAAYAYSVCNPAFASAKGIPRVSGVLTEVIYSGDDAVYVVSAQGKELRLAAPLSTPVISSCEVQMRDFSCGPMRRPVVAYYLPGAAGPFDASAVAIEVRAK